MLVRLSEAIEARDPFSRGHSARVTSLAVGVARELGWAPRQIAALELGGVLHDIGKLAVSARVLRKPASLTPRERAQIELHPAVGARLLRTIGTAWPARPSVLHHHERWDGTGYPLGLAGQEIPLEARLLAIVDAYDAMTSTRAYRSAISLDEALAELERCAGTQFDPELVDAFVATSAAMPIAAASG
jgi:putative nucleotidyltransferase with HDIG domain